MVPLALHSGTTSALYAAALFQSEAASVQPAFQVGAQIAGAKYSKVRAQFAGAHFSQVGEPLGMGALLVQAGPQFALCAYPALQVKSPFAIGAQFALKVGAPLVISAQSVQGKAQYSVCVQLVVQLGAPFAVCAPPAMPVGVQPEMFAADLDKDDANALLKLARKARFSELAGNKIRGFVADLELYLGICARPVHHWGYFLIISFGA